MNVGRTSQAFSALPWSPGHLRASNCQQALCPTPAHLVPLLWFGCGLLFNKAFLQLPGKTGRQDEFFVHQATPPGPPHCPCHIPTRPEAIG